MNKLFKLIRHILHEMVVIFIPKRLRASIMPSCQRVSEMLEEQNLSLSDGVKLRMHLFICQCCTDYKSQLNFMSNEAKKLEKINLTDTQKEKILKSKSEILEKMKRSK